MISTALLPFSSQLAVTARNSPLETSSSSPFCLSKSRPSSYSSCFRVACSGGSPPASATDLKFVLHEALDSAGVDTAHAREGRKGFMAEIEKLTAIERGTSIAINRRVDLWKTALYIALEDDSIVSQSKVPLPVDYFVAKLFDLSMNFCTECSSSLIGSSPEKFLDSLERYLYVSKGFRRSSGENQIDPPALYLHSVFMEGLGSAAMLSLVYSEILKVLRMWNFLYFDCDIFFPLGRYGLPRGFHKQKMKSSDQPHIVTTQTLLLEILGNMKETFWPFQHEHSKSSFLRAADAANCVHRLTFAEESGFRLASAIATRNRLQRGALINLRCGDMRLALSACERLIILGSDPKELRDYSILLYHCGFYDQSLQYLKLYVEREQNFSLQRQSSKKFSNLEEEAVDKLMTRLTFISMEEGWSKPSYSKSYLLDNLETWLK